MRQKIRIVSVGLSFFILTSITEEVWAVRIVAAVMGAIGMYFLPRLYIKRQIRIRNSSYELDLPDFLVHIAMFTEAGLNLWDAIERAAGIGSTDRPLYQDVNEAFAKVHKGVTRDLIAAFEEMAARRNSLPLSNFCVMIIQNVRKGSGELSTLFLTQAQIYRNERRRTAGRLADEAATLLLIPSSIVLGALLLLLLAPAVIQIFGVGRT